MQHCPIHEPGQRIRRKGETVDARCYKKGKPMKKILLIAICLLMTACENNKLAIKELKPMEQTSFMITPQLVYPYKDGFFTCGQDNYLYYYEHLDKAVQISELS